MKYATASSIAPVQLELQTVSNNAILKSETETAFFDLFTATFFDGIGGAEIIFLTSERDAKATDLAEIRDAQKFRSIADTTFLGKNFKDVLAGKPFSGADPKSKTAFYFQKKFGPVAFSLDGGRLFVFDRFE